MSHAVATSPPRSHRRRLVRVGVALLAVVGLFGAHAWYADWRDRREWAEACAEAGRLEPGRRGGDLIAARPVVDPARDSAARVAAIAAKWPPAAGGQKLNGKVQ